MSPGVISGIVRDSHGQPVHGARVFITAAPVSVPDIAALTDADGRFTMAAPAPGRYVVACAGHEGESASEEVYLEDDTAAITLQLG